MKLYKYQGAGNDFLIVDNREGEIRLTTEQIAEVCDRRYGVGADGLMLLEAGEGCDFRMNYYNSDGSGGMMCGNGGRCIVAFAADMGISHFDFEAADGLHSAYILKDGGRAKQVRLKMKDVVEIQHFDTLDGLLPPSEGYFLDTGTRHYVRMVENLEGYDVLGEGREIRYAGEFEPLGANVNFVEALSGILKVRTYEKGVEDETFACGTGIVASSIAAYISGIAPARKDADGRIYYDIRAKKDRLAVDFLPSAVAEDVWLTGPAVFIAEINYKL